MPSSEATEFYSASEIARAAGVDEERVAEMLRYPTAFVRHEDAVRIGRALLQSPPAVPPRDSALLFSTLGSATAQAPSRSGLPLALSGTAHILAFAVVLLLTFGIEPSAIALANASASTGEARLVFMVVPGPGGGGGGGGLLQRTPPPKAQREGSKALSSPLPQRQLPSPAPIPQPPEPPAQVEPLPAVVAPLATVAADSQNRAGVLEETRSTADSRGPGTGGGAGSGRGTGLGEGEGTGVGAGTGGGTGGGPFRPGSGVEAPRLLTEVKPDYTDEARRRGIEGEVVMEIIVRKDGSVSDVKILEGLAAGLNERAIQAVRRWRFAPARLRGAPVDVVVEASVEFRMR